MGLIKNGTSYAGLYHDGVLHNLMHGGEQVFSRAFDPLPFLDTFTDTPIKRLSKTDDYPGHVSDSGHLWQIDEGPQSASAYWSIDETGAEIGCVNSTSQNTRVERPNITFRGQRFVTRLAFNVQSPSNAFIAVARAGEDVFLCYSNEGNMTTNLIRLSTRADLGWSHTQVSMIPNATMVGGMRVETDFEAKTIKVFNSSNTQSASVSFPSGYEWRPFLGVGCAGVVNRNITQLSCEAG